MKTKNYLFIIALAFSWLLPFAAQGQVKIGEDVLPTPGTVLDLKKTSASGYVGGFLLPHVSITDLGYIPEDYTDVINGTLTPVVSGKGVDTDAELTGMLVYNTNETVGCGVYMWDGTDWKSFNFTGGAATYSVIYKANNGTADEVFKLAGDRFETLPSSTFSKEDHYFAGWNTEAGGGGTDYAANNTYGINESMVLYAQWKTLPDPTDPAILTPLVNTYVGAFWKNGQTGERLIRIPVALASAGDWSAVVVAGNDFIRLDTQESPDRANLWNAAKTPGDAEAYQISGSATSVSGYVASSDNIYFRIGLTSANPLAEPRYGCILLTYGSPVKYQYLYIRQGEAPDYVFGKDEVVSTSTTYATARNKAAKFSPYNLTAASLTEGSDYTDIGVYGGSFTDYPTKAGALFQWTNTINPRRAYNPIMNGPVNNTYPSGYWNATTYETCPSGYRRPTDGVTNAEVSELSATPANSELRQSLFLNPQDGNRDHNEDNSLWGYYADGYFDRHAIEAGIIGEAHTLYSAVNPLSKEVAYRGQLFFNPANNKSLFFPASGYRFTDVNNDNLLINTGYIAHYWTSSSFNTFNGWALSTYSGTSHAVYLNRINARNIRCVVAE